MEKNFAGVRVTQKDGTVTQFVAETEVEHALVNSLASAFDEEAIEQGEIGAFLFAIPREKSVSIGLGGSGNMLMRGFLYIQKGLKETMGPVAEVLMDLMGSIMSKEQEDEDKNDG